jgi:hypothetical protein
MITLNTLLALINKHKSEMLLIAESSLPESQFKAFRKLFLSQFGEKGLQGELQRIYAEDQNKVGNGREHITHERGCHHE